MLISTSSRQKRLKFIYRICKATEDLSSLTGIAFDVNEHSNTVGYRELLRENNDCQRLKDREEAPSKFDRELDVAICTSNSVMVNMLAV